MVPLSCVSGPKTEVHLIVRRDETRSIQLDSGEGHSKAVEGVEVFGNAQTTFGITTFVQGALKNTWRNEERTL